jgi:hypothetical protein
LSFKAIFFVRLIFQLFVLSFIFASIIVNAIFSLTLPSEHLFIVFIDPILVFSLLTLSFLIVLIFIY